MTGQFFVGNIPLVKDVAIIIDHVISTLFCSEGLIILIHLSEENEEE